ncbi:unnamed protein product, partial [marine sediment metagenome]
MSLDLGNLIAHFRLAIYRRESLRHSLSLGPPKVSLSHQGLALQVTEFDPVVIDNGYLPDPSTSDEIGKVCPQGATPGNENPRLSQS